MMVKSVKLLTQAVKVKYIYIFSLISNNNEISEPRKLRTLLYDLIMVNFF